MLIVSDTGTDLVNLDNVFAIALGTVADGTTVLMAHGPGVQTVLAAVGDRPKRAAEAIYQAYKQNWKVVDLNDLLGARPNLAVAKPALVVPNGGRVPAPPPG